MKASVIPFVAFACGFSFSCLAQGANNASVSDLKGGVSSQLGNVSKDDRVIVSYKVEEVVNTATGKRVTTYEVSKQEFISTNDLGPNNTRTVTPVYGKSKLKTVEKSLESKSTIVADMVMVKQVGVSTAVATNSAKSISANTEKSVSSNAEKSVDVNAEKLISTDAEKSVSKNAAKMVSANVEKGVGAKVVKSVGVNSAKLVSTNVAKPVSANATKSVGSKAAKSVGSNATKSVSLNSERSVNVNVVNTYEKVLDKGYRSIDMLRKVADKSYFDGNLTAAVKYYAELLEADAAVETVCYYRYAQSLKGLGQMEKADEMMKIYESKKNKK